MSFTIIELFVKNKVAISRKLSEVGAKRPSGVANLLWTFTLARAYGFPPPGEIVRIANENRDLVYMKKVHDWTESFMIREEDIKHNPDEEVLRNTSLNRFKQVISLLISDQKVVAAKVDEFQRWIKDLPSPAVDFDKAQQLNEVKFEKPILMSLSARATPFKYKGPDEIIYAETVMEIPGLLTVSVEDVKIRDQNMRQQLFRELVSTVNRTQACNSEVLHMIHKKCMAHIPFETFIVACYVKWHEEVLMCRSQNNWHRMYFCIPWASEVLRALGCKCRGFVEEEYYKVEGGAVIDPDFHRSKTKEVVLNPVEDPKGYFEFNPNLKPIACIKI